MIHCQRTPINNRQSKQRPWYQNKGETAVSFLINLIHASLRRVDELITAKLASQTGALCPSPLYHVHLLESPLSITLYTLIIKYLILNKQVNNVPCEQ